MIEEGEESDEEEEDRLLPPGREQKGALEGRISPRLQQLQQLSSRKTMANNTTMNTATSSGGGGVDHLAGFDSIV